ncbi:MAG: hypothetical protein HQL31_09525 [Planctomycetes bacterium]|nr:hypothetical protein [Planctomycetota bacterium]
MRKFISGSLSLLGLGLALACGGGGDGTPISSLGGGESAVYMTVASDWTSAATSIVSADNLMTSNQVNPFTTTDVWVFGYGSYYYTLGRYGADFLERYDIANPGTRLYHYSTLDSSETSSQNPQELIFVSDTKAYLTRYASGTQWVVNPAASTEALFKTGVIDLSVYDEGDGSPEMKSGVTVGSKCFLLAQRLNWYQPSYTPYAVVIDTASDTEINTGTAEAGSSLKGIALPARNPGKVVYLESLGKIFVQCTGQFAAYGGAYDREYSGGIATIDPVTYEASLLIDDGDALTGSYNGLFYDMAIVSATKGYLSVYGSWGSLSLRPFNPTTGTVGEVISGFSGVDIRSFGVDSQGRLWIATATGVSLLDPATDTVIQADIDLGLVPNTGNSPAFLQH